MPPTYSGVGFEDGRGNAAPGEQVGGGQAGGRHYLQLAGGKSATDAVWPMERLLPPREPHGDNPSKDKVCHGCRIVAALNQIVGIALDGSWAERPRSHRRALQQRFARGGRSQGSRVQGPPSHNEVAERATMRQIHRAVPGGCPVCGNGAMEIGFIARIYAVKGGAIRGGAQPGGSRVLPQPGS
jgi:hypothetical protein